MAPRSSIPQPALRFQWKYSGKGKEFHCRDSAQAMFACASWLLACPRWDTSCTPSSQSRKKPRSASAEIRGNIIENQFYRITLDPSSGSIASVFDKQLGRELVDSSSPYKFGQYLYVTGGDNYPENSLYRFGAGLKPPALTVHAADSGSAALREENSDRDCCNSEFIGPEYSIDSNRDPDARL